jgi:hypothetical protein
VVTPGNASSARKQAGAPSNVAHIRKSERRRRDGKGVINMEMS